MYEMEVATMVPYFYPMLRQHLKQLSPVSSRGTIPLDVGTYTFVVTCKIFVKKD